VQTVEEVFRLEAPILQLHVGGQIIETTAEHPFYIEGKGWTPVKELHLGNLIIGNNGSKTAIDLINFTSETKPVYNIRVSEDHTYFVGGDGWGFSVWVHNAYRVDGFNVLDEADNVVGKIESGPFGKFKYVSNDGNANWVYDSYDEAVKAAEAGFPARNKLEDASFANEQSLDKHYADHGDEVGAISEFHYESIASDFMTGPTGRGVLERVNKNGDIIRWDPSTNEFGIVTSDGTIRSYYVLDQSSLGRFDTFEEYFFGQ